METPLLNKPRPTNKDIAEYVNRIHACVDEGRRESARERKKQADALHALTKKVDTMAFHLGANEAPTHKTLAAMPIHKALFQQAAATGGVITGLFFLFKLLIVVSPFVYGALVALYHVAIG